MQQIDIEMKDYSHQVVLSDIMKIIKSAVDDFPSLSGKIDKLYVFVFSSKQIKKGIDVKRMHFHSGLTFRSKRPRWSLMYSNSNRKTGVIEVNAEQFLGSSDTRRKFVTRHELGHIFLSGPSTQLTLKNVTIDTYLISTVKKHLNIILELWKEFRVNSLMMKLFPELTIQYMYENPKGFSKSNDQRELRLCQTSFERLLVSVKLEITCEMELAVLHRAPLSLRKKHWKSIEKLHSERMAFLKGQARQIRPELRNVHEWFSEKCFEDKELLVERILGLCFPFDKDTFTHL